MKAGGDKRVTTHAAAPVSRPRKGGKGPCATVRFGSASVPIYLSESKGRKRYLIAHYREGKRMRRAFTDLAAARKEAMFVAQRIQSGLQHVTDLKPHERDSFKKAVEMLDPMGIPLVAAVEDYVQARKVAQSESLVMMAADYRRVCKPLSRANVGQLVEKLLVSKSEDGASKAYLANLKTVLTRFAAAFPGDILTVTSADIDGWLRGLDVSAKSRNGMLICVKVLFSFARSHNCLPAEQMTAAEQIQRARIKQDDDVAVFTPEEMTRLLHAAPPHLIPILAIGAFTGIRMAELNRLDWSAIDLQRSLVELRAGQAKTASRRIVPVSDNLRAWIEPLPRTGKVVRTPALHREVTALARALGIDWPRNVLRHSFISYRIALVKSADQVALEAGNSPTILFKHYRELATEDQARQWFAILPKDGQ